jgi:putative lipoic acid-binding regulatory protein
MKDIDDLHADRPDQGFQFPGVFEITAMGEGDADMETRVPEILAGLGLSVLAGSMKTRPSREGRYLSVSVSFTCPDREHYDAAHGALRAADGIRWTL